MKRSGARLFPKYGVLLAAAILAPVAALPASAQETFADLKSSAREAATLIERARTEGPVSVIFSVGPKGAAPQQTQQSGPVNFNDYIRGLQDQALNSLGWTNLNDLVRYETVPAMAMSVDAERLQQLVASDSVTAVYEDALLTPSLTKTGELTGFTALQSKGITGKGFSVAVLDTGVDAAHPFFEGRVVAEACFSTNHQGPGRSFQSTCPNGQPEQVGPGAAKPCSSGCAHGTHVAGIAAGHNEQGAGVASQAGIVAVQVFTVCTGPRCGDGGRSLKAFTRDVLRGLDWVYKNRERYQIAAANMSLGGRGYTGHCDAQTPYAQWINVLATVGVASVVASGNESFTDALAAPACVSSAISVGATSYDDQVAPFSNSAAFLDILAPGTNTVERVRGSGIISAVPGGYARMPGTSMAAPHVAGAIALLKSAKPDATLKQIVTALKSSGQLVRDTRNGIVKPVIRLEAAVRALTGGQPPVAAPTPKPAPNPWPQPQQPANDDGIQIYEGSQKQSGNEKVEW